MHLKTHVFLAINFIQFVAVSGIFNSIDIRTSNIHDIHYIRDVKKQSYDYVLLVDRGYSTVVQQLDLFETANIKLQTLTEQTTK